MIDLIILAATVLATGVATQAVLVTFSAPILKTPR